MAVDYLASGNRIFRTKTAISLKSTGNTIIIPAQARRIIVTRLIVVPQTFSGAAVAPQMTFGTNASDYDNVYGADGFTKLVLSNDTLVNFTYQVDVADISTPEQFLEYADLTTSGLRVNITTASTATTHTAHIFVEAAIF